MSVSIQAMPSPAAPHRLRLTTTVLLVSIVLMHLQSTVLGANAQATSHDDDSSGPDPPPVVTPNPATPGPTPAPTPVPNTPSPPVTPNPPTTPRPTMPPTRAPPDNTAISKDVMIAFGVIGLVALFTCCGCIVLVLVCIRDPGRPTYLTQMPAAVFKGLISGKMLRPGRTYDAGEVADNTTTASAAGAAGGANSSGGNTPASHPRMGNDDEITPNHLPARSAHLATETYEESSGIPLVPQLRKHNQHVGAQWLGSRGSNGGGDVERATFAGSEGGSQSGGGYHPPSAAPGHVNNNSASSSSGRGTPQTVNGSQFPHNSSMAANNGSMPQMRGSFQSMQSMGDVSSAATSPPDAHRPTAKRQGFGDPTVDPPRRGKSPASGQARPESPQELHVVPPTALRTTSGGKPPAVVVASVTPEVTPTASPQPAGAAPPPLNMSGSLLRSPPPIAVTNASFNGSMTTPRERGERRGNRTTPTAMARSVSFVLPGDDLGDNADFP